MNVGRFVTVTAVLFPVLLAAETIRVPADYLKIQHGINVAVDGDTVLVSPGTYVESFNYMGKRICIRALAGPDSTFLEPAAARLPVALFVNGEDTLSVVERFTVRGARDTSALVCVGSGPIIQHCVITDCQNDWVGAAIICGLLAKPIVRFNDIHHNESLLGAALYVGAYARVEVAYNVIHHNTGERPGVGVAYGIAHIHHNILHDNVGTGYFWWRDAAIWVQGSGHRVYNNTLVRNTVGIYANSGSATISNNIVASGRGGLIADSTSAVRFNNVWSNLSFNDSWTFGISANPLFVDSISDFALAPGSPCINSGDPSAAFNDPDGTRNDIGAIPLAGFPPYAPTLLAPTNDSIVSTLHPLFVWTEAHDADLGDEVTYDFSVSLESTFASSIAMVTLKSTTLADTLPLEQGHRYWWRVGARDLLGWASLSSTASFRTYLPGDANGSLVVSAADIVVIVNFVFKGGSLAAPSCAADCDGSGSIGTSDIIVLVGYVFRGDAMPVSGCG